MTPDLLTRATGTPPPLANHVAAPLTIAMAKYGITTPLRQAHFVAQCAHESLLFNRWEEDLHYHAHTLTQVWPTRFFLPPDKAECTLRSGSIVIRKDARDFEMKPEALANEVYGGRMGNTQPGDGWRFRARGPLGLTGRDNYTALNAAEPTIPCISAPDAIATTEFGCVAAAWFWAKHGCNGLADQDNVGAVTSAINGGLVGLTDRIAITNRAKQALGCA